MLATPDTQPARFETAPETDELEALIQEARRRTRRRRAGYAAALAALAVLGGGLHAAFTSSGHGTPSHPAPRVLATARHGTLKGVLTICCSAPPHESTAVRGVVLLKRIGGTSHLIKVNHTGHFSISLPPGKYLAVGGAPSLGWKLGKCGAGASTISPYASPAATPIILSPNTTTQTSIVCAGW